MYLLGVDPTLAPEVRRSVVAAMRERGPTGVVDRRSDEGLDEADADVHARYDETAGWELAVPETRLETLLDEMAVRCEYALVDDPPGDRLPMLWGAGEEVHSDLHPESIDRESFSPPELVDRLESTEPWESLESLVARIKRSPERDRAGAIATFTGRVRARDAPEDTPTSHLEFEAYGEVAWNRMERIADEISSRDGVYDVVMHHRTGVIQDGEDIVFVVVLAGHRDEAFTAVEDGINRLKAEVPIFKKEVTVDEEYWVHTRP